MQVLSYCTEEQTLDLMIQVEQGHSFTAAREWMNIIGSHPAMTAYPSFMAIWTVGRCTDMLSDYYRKHFAPKYN